MSRGKREHIPQIVHLSKASVCDWRIYNYNYFSSPKIIWPSLKIYKILIFWCGIVFIITEILDSTMIDQFKIRKYFQSLKWTPLPIGVGFVLIAYQQYHYTRKREAAKIGHSRPCDILADEWEVKAYKLLPLRTVSRTWGWLTRLELPEWSRSTLLGSYVKTFGCDMSEAEIEDLNKYKCLSEFFKRKLKIGVRPVDTAACIVSPADGTVLHRGKVNCGMMDQVKGVSYSAKQFLGPNCWSEGGPMVISENDEKCFHSSCLQNPRKNELFYVTVYLAPGDYHRFHSPSDWKVSFRRHFPGELFSVNPSIASWIKDLFVLNERVSYVGWWNHGFFSLTAIGATNVGSIVVPFDEDLKTNTRRKQSTFFDKHFEDRTIEFNKGQEFGEFNLGSTIVLIFEAPKDTILSVQPGQKVKVGQALYCSSNLEAKSSSKT